MPRVQHALAVAMGGQMPTMNHSAPYSAPLACLLAAKVANSIEGYEVVAQMRKAHTDDQLYGRVTVRPDGRAVHDMFVFKVKGPAESKSKDDVYALLETIPADQAFRPLEDGGWPLVSQ